MSNTDQIFSVRLPIEELEKLRKKAAIKKLPLSRIFREAIRKYAFEDEESYLPEITASVQPGTPFSLYVYHGQPMRSTGGSLTPGWGESEQ